MCGEYFNTIGFNNISEARFLMQKAVKEKYPADFIEELAEKIEDYEHYVECDV